MNAARKIQRIGFRKWYERELLQSHAYLVLLLLSTLGLLGSAEAYGLHLALSSQLLVLACATASALIGFWALRRYLYLLKHAEFVADQAVCRACQTYARWEILEEVAQPAQDRLRVRCKRCSHVWLIVL
jgi:hypothetical protein